MKAEIAFVLTIVSALAGSCGPGRPSSDETSPAATSSVRSSELVQPENWWDVLPRPGYAKLEKVGEFQSWFEVYKLLDGTYALYEPYQFQEAISYLVLGSEKAVLIDTGNGIGNIEEVVSKLTDLPVTVLVTHEHPDHFGGAHLFERVAIFDHPQAIERLKEGVPHERAGRIIDTESDYVWKPLPASVDPETFSIPGVEPTERLEDGQVIDLGGRRLEVIHTPGHSAGSACFLDTDRRLLFTGDHFYPGPLYAHGRDVDVDAYVASNEKLTARMDDYDHVLSGHNEPWVDAEVIPRVTEAFHTILAGEGAFSEDDGLRRYHFDGFDILIRAEQIRGRASPRKDSP